MSGLFDTDAWHELPESYRIWLKRVKEHTTLVSLARGFRVWVDVSCEENKADTRYAKTMSELGRLGYVHDAVSNVRTPEGDEGYSRNQQGRGFKAISAAFREYLGMLEKMDEVGLISFVFVQDCSLLGFVLTKRGRTYVDFDELAQFYLDEFEEETEDSDEDEDETEDDEFEDVEDDEDDEDDEPDEKPSLRPTTGHFNPFGGGFVQRPWLEDNPWLMLGIQWLYGDYDALPERYRDVIRSNVNPFALKLDLLSLVGSGEARGLFTYDIARFTGKRLHVPKVRDVYELINNRNFRWGYLNARGLLTVFPSFNKSTREWFWLEVARGNGGSAAETLKKSSIFGGDPDDMPMGMGMMGMGMGMASPTGFGFGASTMPAMPPVPPMPPMGGGMQAVRL